MIPRTHNPAANRQRRAVLALGATAALVLSGCAAPAITSAPSLADAPAWSGRMSLQVESSPPQSLAAVFDLKGSAEAGQLSLSTPLGNTLAQLAWSAGSATLRTPRETREYPSVDALLAEVTGTQVPVAALFDWLAGKPADVDGWQADLSQHADGRLRARRSAPAPAADLRLAFERQ